MGKAAKEHRKKVAKRNQQLKAGYKKFEQAVQTFIEEQKKPKNWLADQTKKEVVLNPHVMSAYDQHLADKNKNKQDN
jgi:hypothetical protein